MLRKVEANFVASVEDEEVTDEAMNFQCKIVAATLKEFKVLLKELCEAKGCTLEYCTVDDVCRKQGIDLFPAHDSTPYQLMGTLNRYNFPCIFRIQTYPIDTRSL